MTGVFRRGLSVGAAQGRLVKGGRGPSLNYAGRGGLCAGQGGHEVGKKRSFQGPHVSPRDGSERSLYLKEKKVGLERKKPGEIVHRGVTSRRNGLKSAGVPRPIPWLHQPQEKKERGKMHLPGGCCRTSETGKKGEMNMWKKVQENVGKGGDQENSRDQLLEAV